MADAPDPRLAAYAFCLEHAVVDGAFPEGVMLQWFNAAWQLCADHIGLVYPAQTIREDVNIDPRSGVIKLSHEPSSAVQFFVSGRLVATLSPNSPCFGPQRSETLCCPQLCCYCGCLRAVYQVGQNYNGCGDEIPATFVQAVAQVFAYIAENRGDTQREPGLLARCGALPFLSSRTTYVL